MDTALLVCEKWLEESQAQRDELAVFAKQPVLDINEAIQKSAEVSIMEARAVRIMSGLMAHYTLRSRGAYPSNSVDERKVIVKDQVADFQFILDSISVTSRILRDRIYHNPR